MINEQCHTWCLSMRLSRRWLGLERLYLRFTQRIATAMHFVPARRPAARHCDYAQHKSLRHYPGSLVLREVAVLVQYTG